MADRNSFIANVNLIAAHLPSIEEANGYFSEEVVTVLREIMGLKLDVLIEDLIKDNYLGNKKLDIDLKKNMNGSGGVGYSGATVYFMDGTVYSFNFTSDDYTTTEATNQGLIRQFDNNQGFNDRLTGTAYFGVPYEDEDGVVDPQIVLCVRFYPVLGEISNLSHIVLHVSNTADGNHINANPSYSWSDTTSSLDVIANNISEILEAMKAVEDLSAIAINISALLDIQRRLPELVTNPLSIYNMRNELHQIFLDLAELLKVHEYRDQAEIFANDAKGYAQEAKDAIATTATPTRRGVVYTSSDDDILNGTADHMVDAFQLKTELDKRIQPATTTTAGIVTIADPQDIQSGVGDGVITSGNVWAITSASGVAGDVIYNGNGELAYTTTVAAEGLSTARIYEAFGTIAVISAGTTLPLIASFLDPTKVGFSATPLGSSTSVRPIMDIDAVSVTIRLYDESVSAFIAGEASVHLVGKIGSGLFPLPPSGFSAWSSYSGAIEIRKA